MKAMKKTILMMVLGLLANAGTPVERLVPVKNIFSPEGFDSNDNVEVIVEGHLPNLCHKTPMKTVSINGNSIGIFMIFSKKTFSQNLLVYGIFHYCMQQIKKIY